jgi:hypothetical protein
MICQCCEAHGLIHDTRDMLCSVGARYSVISGKVDRVPTAMVRFEEESCEKPRLIQAD